MYQAHVIVVGDRPYPITDGEPLFVTMTGRAFGLNGAESSGGLSLVGELSSRAVGEPLVPFNIAVDGGYAYLACDDGLDIVDISDPVHPTHVSHLPAPGANDIKVVSASGRKYAFIAAGDTYLVDVTDPHAPVLRSSIDAYSHSLQIAERGSSVFLYVAGLGSAIPIFDVTDPLVPINLGFIRPPDSKPGEDTIHDLYVDGSVLYVNAGAGGTVALDVSEGFKEPVELGRFRPQVPAFSHASWAGTVGSRKIVLTGDEGGTGTQDGMAFLRILDGDTLSPDFMREIGRYQTRQEVGIHYFQLVGQYVVVAYYHDGVRVVDLSDPTAPHEVAHFNTWNNDTSFGALYEGAIALRVVGDLIFVADSVRGLIVLRSGIPLQTVAPRLSD